MRWDEQKPQFLKYRKRELRSEWDPQGAERSNSAIPLTNRDKRGNELSDNAETAENTIIW